MRSSAILILLINIFVVCISAFTVPLSKESLSQINGLNNTSTPDSLDPVGPFCHGSSSWRGSSEFDWRFRASCQSAAKLLWTREVKQHTDTDYEFLDYNTPPAHDNPLMRTPRRYSYRECTIALAMINDVPARYIHDGPTRLAPATEVTSYDDIWHAVNVLRQACLIDGTSLGWTALGRSSALVVLVIGTNSPIDQAIPYGVHPLAIGNLTDGGTVAIAGG